MTTKTKKMIFWAIVILLLIALGVFLKYASLGITIITIIVGLGSLVAGWVLRILYCKYIK